MHRLPCALSALALLALATPAMADCPPLGKLPGYVLEDGGPARRAFDQHVFLSGNDDEQQETTVAGRTCRATYLFPDGTGSPMSDLEIQSNYREQLRGLGGQVTFERSRDTHAMLEKAGTQTWFHVYSQEDRIEVVVVAYLPHKQVLSKPAQGDYRLLGRMPGYVLGGEPETRAFDEADFHVVDSEGAGADVMVQGARYSVAYAPDADDALASDLDIHENYRAAIRALGGEILRADRAYTTARLLHQGQVVWIKLYSQEDHIELTAIEEKPFASSLQAPAADDLKRALDAVGRVTLYLNFDFAKATLRADAEPVLVQVVQLLEAHPDLRLTIEGHTDDVGADEANQSLSHDRAAAVVAALGARGIAAGRLDAAGFGESKPLAGNDTSEGRARNRRVELVRR